VWCASSRPQVVYPSLLEAESWIGSASVWVQYCSSLPFPCAQTSSYLAPAGVNLLSNGQMMRFILLLEDVVPFFRCRSLIPICFWGCFSCLVSDKFYKKRQTYEEAMDAMKKFTGEGSLSQAEEASGKNSPSPISSFCF
jgi:hypothetical protein